MPNTIKHICLFLAAFAVVTIYSGCTSETTNPNGDYTRVTAIDTVHFGFAKGTKAITLEPVKATTVIRTTNSPLLSDSVVLVTFMTAAVADTTKYQFRKHYYEVADTLHLAYDNAVDELGLLVRDTQQVRIDSIWISIPALNPPMIIPIHP